VHEAANVLNQARASQKMGDVGAMLDFYERLIRSEVALEDVETDMERVSKDAVHKSNPAVLRVYGDALLRRGKLQQALDTYRAALNLL
jgi:predicted negative regulator of RcsB-dependent stress response